MVYHLPRSLSAMAEKEQIQPNLDRSAIGSSAPILAIRRTSGRGRPIALIRRRYGGRRGDRRPVVAVSIRV
jgi:hypothetical protein